MPSTPRCPRCGYDQSGHLAGAGPAPGDRGVCPECGLAFEWADVLDPDRWRLAGLAEHAKRPLQFARWAVRTWWWALLPWRFWARVKLHHRVRPWMLLAWLGVVAALPHVLRGALDVFWAAVFSPWGGRVRGWGLLDPLVSPVASLSGPWSRLPRAEWRFLDWPAVSLWLLGVALLWPAALGLMPISLRRASVRWSHVARATAYSAAAPAIYFWIELAQAALAEGWLVFGPARLTGQSRFAYDVYEYGAVAEAWLIRLAIPWVALWWLLVLTMGWKLRHGWVAWLAMVLLVGAICVAVFGVEITLLGRVYRW